MTMDSDASFSGRVDRFGFFRRVDHEQFAATPSLS
jgi:hypothetical protein